MNPHKKISHVLIIYGATGVGKTDFALQVARQASTEIINSNGIIKSAEIINMDVGSFYTPLTIGTAKPDWRNELITHHMFDILDEPKNYTVVAYRNACLQLIDAIIRRGNLPILVGGSGFYLKSLFFPPIMPTILNAPAILNTNVSSNVNGANSETSGANDTSANNLGANDSTTSDTNTAEQLWNQLNIIDQDRAQTIDKHDEYRIKRALEVWATTGTKPSLYEPRFDFSIDCHLVHVYRNRDDLYARINKRVLHMLKSGWMDEVKQLRGGPWENFIRHKKIIGYCELFDYIESIDYIKSIESDHNHHSNSNDLNKIIMTIQKKTRLYAKRQMTFWRMLERDFSKTKHSVPSTNITEANLNIIDYNSYIKKLLSCIFNETDCICEITKNI